MHRRGTAEQHEKIERELHAERAAALLRISRTLESAIEQLRAAQERAAQLTGPDERAREVARCEALRRHALQYRWYLEVQREALGLRQHHRLDEFYPIPEPLDLH
jgi:hypothetical protein